MSNPTEHLQQLIDDSELVALKALHIGLKEYEGATESATAEWDAVLKQHIAKYAGREHLAVLGLVSAMSRQASLYIELHLEGAAKNPRAYYTDRDSWLEHWTMEKLEQHVYEKDHPELLDDPDDDRWLCVGCQNHFDEDAVSFIDGRYLCRACA